MDDMVEPKWGRVKAFAHLLYVLMVILFFVLTRGASDYTVFIACIVTISVLFYYVQSRIRYAENNIVEIPKELTAKVKKDMFRQLIGSPFMFVSYILVSVFSGIFTLVVFNVF